MKAVCLKYEAHKATRHIGQSLKERTHHHGPISVGF